MTLFLQSLQLRPKQKRDAFLYSPWKTRIVYSSAFLFYYSITIAFMFMECICPVWKMGTRLERMTGNTMRAIFHILRRFRRIAGHFVNKSWTPFEIIGILRVFAHQMKQPSAFNSFKPRPFVGLMHESVWRHFRLLFSINWCYLRQLVDYNGRPGSGRVIWRFQVNTLMISNEIMS